MGCASTTPVMVTEPPQANNNGMLKSMEVMNNGHHKDGYEAARHEMDRILSGGRIPGGGGGGSHFSESEAKAAAEAEMERLTRAVTPTVGEMMHHGQDITSKQLNHLMMEVEGGMQEALAELEASLPSAVLQAVPKEDQDSTPAAAGDEMALSLAEEEQLENVLPPPAMLSIDDGASDVTMALTPRMMPEEEEQAGGGEHETTPKELLTEEEGIPLPSAPDAPCSSPDHTSGTASPSPTVIIATRRSPNMTSTLAVPPTTDHDSDSSEVDFHMSLEDMEFLEAQLRALSSPPPLAISPHDTQGDVALEIPLESSSKTPPAGSPGGERQVSSPTNKLESFTMENSKNKCEPSSKSGSPVAGVSSENAAPPSNGAQ